MAQDVTLPSEAEREAFARRLGEFRTDLLPSEQRILDAMVMVAFSPVDDVQAYTNFYDTSQVVGPNSSPNPWWYAGSGTSAWNQSRWGQSYIITPVVVNPNP